MLTGFELFGGYKNKRASSTRASVSLQKLRTFSPSDNLLAISKLIKIM